MSKCVAIEVADDGTVKVGLLPEGAAEQYAQAMQPAESVEAALDMASQMIGSAKGEAGPGSAQEAVAAEKDFATGFKGPMGL